MSETCNTVVLLRVVHKNSTILTSKFEEPASAATPAFAQSIPRRLTVILCTIQMCVHQLAAEKWSLSGCTTGAGWCFAAQQEWCNRELFCKQQHQHCAKADQVNREQHRGASPSENVHHFCQLFIIQVRLATGNQLSQRGVGKRSQSLNTGPTTAYVDGWVAGHAKMGR
jgi:hypothetical protein